MPDMPKPLKIKNTKLNVAVIINKVALFFKRNNVCKFKQNEN